MTELSIDTASELASIAVSNEGVLLAEMTWRCRRNHTVELLPSIDKLLAQTKVAREDITAVFVTIGPGTYTGLRVGVTTAKALAHALGVPIVGVGRLELDAYPHAAFDGDVIAVHKAGRGEYAWAAYRGAPWREVAAPQLAKPAALANAAASSSLFVGEIDEALTEALPASAVVASPASSLRRAASLAELAYGRLASGQTDEAALLVPMYLRPPAIGPQPPVE
ncbi:MAG: tRNA (adenosine(37)-N6)-threonylcarbamoyltransferase complex dimerization subunit type 1 TsaB [Chloroflexota bacterium]